MVESEVHAMTEEPKKFVHDLKAQDFIIEKPRAYPENWPRCPVCDDYALDGHITCGRFGCNEHEQRRLRQR